MERLDMGLDDEGYLLNEDGERIKALNGEDIHRDDMFCTGAAIFHEDILPDEIEDFFRKD
jgi:hypothetical protein